MFPQGFWPGPSGGTTTPLPITSDIPPVAQGSAPAMAWTILDTSKSAVDLTGKVVRFVAYRKTQPDGDCDPFDAELTALHQYDTDSGGVSISGAHNNRVTVQHSQTNTATAGHFFYWLLNVTDRIALASGKFPIKPAVWSA